jgi:murein DD-endopeptidase MepM/ murein hydrolase activator NlpD
MIKIKIISGLFCCGILLVQPVNQVVEALVHFGYTEVSGVAIAMPIPESDHPIETIEVENIPAVAEYHEVSFDLSKPYDGQKIGDGFVTSPQGWRIHPISGTRKMHHGVDWSKNGEGGTPLYAPGRIEVVCKAQRNGSGQLTGAGYYAEFQFYGMTWQLMHLQKDSCVAGGHEKGWVIGRVGTTGSSTGNHLHLSLRGPNREFLHVGTGHVAAVVIQPGD